MLSSGNFLQCVPRRLHPEILEPSNLLWVPRHYPNWLEHLTIQYSFSHSDLVSGR